MSTTEIWLVIAGGLIVTYLTRLSFLLLIPSDRMPAPAQRALRYAPSSVLAAIIVPQVVLGPEGPSAFNPRIVAALVAALVAWRTKSTWLTMALGMLALWAALPYSALHNLPARKESRNLPVTVRRLDLDNASDIDRFIRFPYRLYRHDPHWVPTMRGDMELALDPQRHPYYDHSEAAFFLAESGPDVLGRIAALNPARYNRHNRSRTGFFYYYEAVVDPVVTQELFAAVFDWLRERDLERVLGPKGLLQGEGAGLLIDGFDRRPAMGIPYNPDYYPRRLEELGFAKVTDYLSGHLDRTYQLPERLHRIAERVKTRRGYSVRGFEDKESLRAWIPRFQEVYNRAFRTAFGERVGFAPMTERETQVLADRLLSISHPNLIKLVMKDDEWVGFLIAYPNIGPAIRRAKGRLWPLGWLHILLELRRTRWLDINGIGILPEHQGMGANAILYTELERTLQNAQYEHADVVQIREENAKSMGDMRALGVTWYKRHRLYERSL